MSEQPIALFYADCLERVYTYSTAAELRRLHALNVELLEALSDLERVAGTDCPHDDPARVAARALLSRIKEQQ